MSDGGTDLRLNDWKQSTMDLYISSDIDFALNHLKLHHLRGSYFDKYFSSRAKMKNISHQTQNYKYNSLGI